LKYCIDSNQIFQNNKDQQSTLRGWYQYVSDESKMADSHHFANNLSNGSTDHQEIWHCDTDGPFCHIVHQKQHVAPVGQKTSKSASE